MERVVHKTFGLGEVVGRETKTNGTYITIRFESGKVMRCAIPESFTLGIMVAEGTLKDEVDAAITEKRAIEYARLQRVCTPTVPTRKITHRTSSKMRPHCMGLNS